MPWTSQHTAADIDGAISAMVKDLTGTYPAVEKTTGFAGTETVALNDTGVMKYATLANLSAYLESINSFNDLSDVTITTQLLGDLVYASSGVAWVNLPGNITTTRKFFRQTGNGSISAAPAWDTVTSTDVGLGSVENTALSTWAGTANVTTVGTLVAGAVPWSLLTSVPATFAPAAHTLDSHSNVTITANSDGETLRWNGSAWINNTLAELGVALAGHDHSGVYQPIDTQLTAIAALADAAGSLTNDGAGNMSWAAAGSGAPSTATYIVQTASAGLSAEQVLGSLATGIVKNTTTTGVLSIASQGTDYYAPGGTDVAVADGGTGASTLTGILRGNGTAAFTVITVSSTVGQVLRVTGADTYAFGAVDLADTDAVTGILPAGNGGSGIAFFAVTGPATSVKTFTLPNASSTILTSNAAVTVAQGGTGAATLTGLLRGNGTSAFTVITTSSTVGQCLRVTGADTYAFGALDMADTDAVTGILAAGNGGTGLAFFAAAGPASTVKTMTFPNASTTIAGIDTVQTLTNKRLNPRVHSTASTTSMTIDTDSYDMHVQTALAGAVTFNVPSGTPVNGQRLIIRIKDNGSARAITWDSAASGFRAIGITLPTTTVISKTHYIGFIWNSTDSKWDGIAVVAQA
jgi:uncharacterized membrane protein